MKRLEEMDRKAAEEKAQLAAVKPVKTTKPAARRNSNGKIAERLRQKTAQEDRASLVLWRKPFLTLAYFFCEIPCSLRDAKDRFIMSLYEPKKKSIPPARVALIFLFWGSIAYGTYFWTFKEDAKSAQLKEQITWYTYWIFLGVLSSVGLGTGLHTFILYLGPFIAKVTVAAHECASTDFPRPPYPDQVICPEPGGERDITIWDIMTKVRWESLMWGFGTALGELPPYFMARAARISGMGCDDEEMEEFEELQRKKKADPSTLSWLERGKLWMEDIVEKVGFWGILACASIPNPLFDLAGITCGHFMVPFTTFFSATVIGKAFVKTHLQMTFVILAFNEDLLKSAVSLISMVPKIGPLVSEPFMKLMDHQKQSLHHNTSDSNTEGGLVAYALEKLVLCMVTYFIISIVNSMAQAYHKRLQREKKVKS